jgi:hypothetical protein
MQNLLPIEVPWCISPSISHLTIYGEEDGNTVICANTYSVLDKNNFEDERVRLTFKSCSFIRTYPTFGDDLKTHGYISSFEEIVRNNPELYLKEFREKWIETSFCPDSGVYEVENSLWLIQVHGNKWNLKHFIIQGHDSWVELLAEEVKWEYQ